MQNLRKIDEDLFYVGANDRRIALFENVYPVPYGVSYNAYFIYDEKTCLIDTVDKSAEKQFKENLACALSGRGLDYIVVNHMEPDHSATLGEILKDYPTATVVCNAKIATMIGNYFEYKPNFLTVKEGDSLPLGKHTLHFVDTPMVHWPEVMMTYDEYSKTLFSADAFGSFGAVSGNLYADEIKYKGAYTDEMRRYYTNIVGKYGVQVQAALKKAATLDIKRICPLHGLIWRANINYLLEKYNLWSTYTPETRGVLVVYASVYGNTENAAEIIAARLNDNGVKNVAVYDVSKTDASYLIAEAFKYSHIVIASTTYNAGIFVNMENFLNDLVAHGICNRTFSVVENGSWAATSGKLIKEKLATLKNCEIIGETVKITSSVKSATRDGLLALADEISKEIVVAAIESGEADGAIDKTAFFKLSYGLFVLTSKDEKDNACIVNTVIQLTDSPKRIAFAVNKANYSRDIIAKTKKFNACIVSQKETFDVFKRFGFASGRDTDKFDGFTKTAVSANGLKYITENTCGFISGEVIAMKDFGTHTLFIAEVTEAKTLSDEKPMTYEYYFDNVKPKPQQAEEKKKGYVCKICGYVYEGEELPEDFVCPLCKHGADDFEKL